MNPTESNPVKNMKILVTGGAGFIGTNLIALLLEAGYEVLNVDSLTYAAYPEIHKEFHRHQRYRLVELDIVYRQSLTEIVQKFQPASIIHLAAQTHVDRSIKDSAPFVHANVVGTSSLLAVSLDYWRSLAPIAQSTFRFLHVSTDEVYGSLQETGYFTESSPYNPHSPYAASKAAADHLARAWVVTYGFPAIIIHPCNNYGPYQHPEKLIPMVIQSCLGRLPINVYGCGQQVRDWLHVEDHCRALIRVLQAGRLGQSYNVGANNQWRNLDLIKVLCDLFDSLRQDRCAESSQTLIRFVDDRPGHDYRYALDCTKIGRELSWSAQTDPLTGLRRTMRWYLQNPGRLAPAS